MPNTLDFIQFIRPISFDPDITKLGVATVCSSCLYNDFGDYNQRMTMATTATQPPLQQCLKSGQFCTRMVCTNFVRVCTPERILHSMFLGTQLLVLYGTGVL